MYFIIIYSFIYYIDINRKYVLDKVQISNYNSKWVIGLTFWPFFNNFVLKFDKGLLKELVIN